MIVVGCLIAGGCGGGGSRRARARGSAVTVVMASAPNSLDPAVGSNSEALEADWLVYTPLLTYLHASGATGTRVIPGLAQTLPFIWDGGRGYTLKLRPGLTYSNGEPVQAGDFTRAVQRAIRLWPPARQLIVPRIVGAKAYAEGRRKTILGITTDDAKGQVTIYLTAPDGTFENVLALPALAPVPAGTPMREEQTPTPPGAGPYTLANVVPGRSFSLIRNPAWGRMGVPDVPAGRVDVEVKITGDARSNAQSVLADRADLFDWPDPIPTGLLARIRARAGDRYLGRSVQSTDLIFMNVNRKPFSSQLAREAVRTGIDEATMADLDDGMLQTGCYLLPPTLFGHPHDSCRDGTTGVAGNLAKARSLLERSGMAGTPVTVWSETTAPVREWMSYYTSLLDQIGLSATLKTLAPQRYYQTISGRAAATGFGEINPVLPNPATLYQQLTGQLPSPTGTQNWSQISDPHIDATVRALSAVPASTVEGIQDFWQQLERYVAGQEYVAVLGYPTVPEFVSSRIDLRRLILSPVTGYDWTSVQLN